jgi:DNA-binding NarL/FixJ family response regulator
MCVSKHRILLIDDDASSQLYDELKKLKKYHIFSVARSNEALQLSAQAHFVFLNMNPADNDPEMFHFLCALRAQGCRSFLCLFNCSPSSEFLFHAVSAGIDDYIFNCSFCNLLKEVERLVQCVGSEEKIDSDESFGGPAKKERCACLRSAGLSESEIRLLGNFADTGYPRIKEFAAQLGVSETSIWKRLARIREKLNMDSMSQIAHLLTLLLLADARREKRREEIKQRGGGTNFSQNVLLMPSEQFLKKDKELREMPDSDSFQSLCAKSVK